MLPAKLFKWVALVFSGGSNFSISLAPISWTRHGPGGSLGRELTATLPGQQIGNLGSDASRDGRSAKLGYRRVLVVGAAGSQFTRTKKKKKEAVGLNAENKK